MPVGFVVQVPITTLDASYAVSIIDWAAIHEAAPSTYKPTLPARNGNVKPITSVLLLRFKDAVPPGTSAAVVLLLQSPQVALPFAQSARGALEKLLGAGAVNTTPLLKVKGITGTVKPPDEVGFVGEVGTPSKDSTTAPPPKDGTVTHCPKFLRDIKKEKSNKQVKSILNFMCLYLKK